MPDKQKKPVLITVSGLTGSGKSTTARALAAALPNTVHIDSDETRKEIFGVPATQKLPPEAYTHEATLKLIIETERRIRAHLAAGRNVVQSVMLVSEAARDRQEVVALEAKAEFQGIWLKSDFRTMHDRVAARKGDASDAGTAYVEEQASWNTGEVDWPIVDANQPREDVLREALDILRPLIAPAPRPAQKAGPPSRPGSGL